MLQVTREVLVTHYELFYVKHGHYRSGLLLLGRTSARTLGTRTRAETDTWQRKLLDDDRETW